VRKGLWRVVNEDGGTGGRGRLKNVQVAGKTGTAQATDRGHKDTVAWFACFAPFDHPKYVVAVMVQGGEHGGSVAGPVATRISGTDFGDGRRQFRHASGVGAASASREPIFDVQRRQLCGGNLGAGDEESADASSADVQMASDNASPDVEPEADAQGQVSKRPRVVRAAPAPPPRQPNFFERLFGGKRPAPQPAPTPVRPSF